jgi:quinoprotein relay system zinc metallohydrolase 1
MTRPSQFPVALALAGLLLAAPAWSQAVTSTGPQPATQPAAQPAVPAATATGPRVDMARLDYGLRARSLAEGVWVVEGTNADFSPANGCNIINTGFIATGGGVLVINTGPSRLYGEQLRALIARTTREPIAQVLHLNLHPDYFLGNQAFAGVPIAATADTRAGMQREAASYETNLYRLCGDWMKGTEARLPTQTIGPGPLRIGQREFELREFRGHTASDLVLVDKASGVVFAGGLVFSDRVPTTPHADAKAWLAALDGLAATKLGTVVPSHGPVHTGTRGLQQTREFLQWLDASFTRWAAQGWDMNEVLRATPPEAFTRWAAWPAEYTRNVAHLYPAYERAALQRGKRP